jgi:hypothetical protein
VGAEVMNIFAAQDNVMERVTAILGLHHCFHGNDDRKGQ